MGENDFEFRRGSGEVANGLEGGGNGVGVGTASGFGDVEIDGPIMRLAEVGEFEPTGGLGVEFLNTGVEFANALKPEVGGVLELFGNVSSGMDGSESDKAIGGMCDPVCDGFVVGAAVDCMFPIPTEEDGFFDARSVHIVEHGLWGGPCLNRGTVEWSDEIGPMGFIVFLSPSTRIGDALSGVTMGMTIYDRGRHYCLRMQAEDGQAIAIAFTFTFAITIGNAQECQPRRGSFLFVRW